MGRRWGGYGGGLFAYRRSRHQAGRGGATERARAVRLDRLMKHLVPARLINAGESATRQLAERNLSEREVPSWGGIWIGRQQALISVCLSSFSLSLSLSVLVPVIWKKKTRKNKILHMTLNHDCGKITVWNAQYKRVPLTWYVHVHIVWLGTFLFER